MYLQAVAATLAEPDATPERVLRVARARDARRVVSYIEFVVPDPRVKQTNIKLAEGDDLDSPPQSVDFRFDPDGPPVTLAEVASAFGAWEKAYATGLSDPRPVNFTAPYPASPQAGRARTAVTYVRATLDADPIGPGTRVRRVLLRRFSLDP